MTIKSRALVLIEQEDGSHIHGIVSETELQSASQPTIRTQSLSDSSFIHAAREQIIQSLSLSSDTDATVSHKVQIANELEPETNWGNYLYAIVSTPDQLDLVQVKGAILLEDDGPRPWSRDNLISMAEFYAPGQKLPEARSVFEEEMDAPYPLLIAIPARTDGSV